MEKIMLKAPPIQSATTESRPETGQWYWIVNPKTYTVEVYELSGKEYGLAGEFSTGEKVVSPLLGDVGFTADSLFDT